MKLRDDSDISIARRTEEVPFTGDTNPHGPFVDSKSDAHEATR
jgi:hypothetical protein